MDLVADLPLMLTDFGVNATLSVGGTATGVFDNGYVDVLQIVGSASRAFTGSAADLAAVTIGSTLTIDSVAYTVAALEPDGTGVTRVILK